MIATRVVLREPATGSEAQVVLDLGANVHRFRTRVGGRDVDVLASAPDADTLRARPTRFGSAPLFPYPGRIEAGRFIFAGREIQSPSPVSAPQAYLPGECTGMEVS